jgi:peptide/nickel transport system permease protein
MAMPSSNALLPVLTTLGMVFGFMLGASVLVEKVFAWPGIGSVRGRALTASDYAPVQGFVLTMGVLYVLLNLAVDLLYWLIDPRVTAWRADMAIQRTGLARPPRAGENPVTAAGLRAVRDVRRAGGGGALDRAPYDPLASNAAVALQPPSARHWFGTDALGRDISRGTMVATRLDLGIAVSAVALSFVHRHRLGLLAGYFGGWWDLWRDAGVRHHHGLPAVRAGHGHRGRAGQHRGQHRAGHRGHQPARSTCAWRAPRPTSDATPASSRRRGCPATATGASWRATCSPTSCRRLMVQVSLNMGWAILNCRRACRSSAWACARRSPEWGILVAEGAQYIVSGEWWVSFFPGAVLMLAVFSFNLLGDALRDILDPRKRT